MSLLMVAGQGYVAAKLRQNPTRQSRRSERWILTQCSEADLQPDTFSFMFSCARFPALHVNVFLRPLPANTPSAHDTERPYCVVA
jgi:hypothetical protein